MVWRPREITALAEEKCPIEKVLGIFLETFAKFIIWRSFSVSIVRGRCRYHRRGKSEKNTLSAEASSRKSFDAEFARVYDAQKNVVTFAKSKTFRDAHRKKRRMFRENRLDGVATSWNHRSCRGKMPYQKSARHFSRDIRQYHRLNLVFNLEFWMTLKKPSSLSQNRRLFTTRAEKPLLPRKNALSKKC